LNADGLHAVLFDMDGLLVDSEPLWFDVECEVMARLGGSWHEADQEQLVGGSLDRSVGYMLAKAATPFPPAVVAGWITGGMARRLRAGGVPMMPGAAELLAEVSRAGVPHALVTSAEREIMDMVIEKTGVGFDATVCAADVSRGKPAPEPYLLAAKLLGADPGRCVALEDSVNGVASAEAAGCVTVAVPGVAAVRERPGRTVVTSLREISLARLRGLVPGSSGARSGDGNVRP
jgi:HAD superfamily hydrolase (TIGR01509 family)